MARICYLTCAECQCHTTSRNDEKGDCSCLTFFLRVREVVSNFDERSKCTRLSLPSRDVLLVVRVYFACSLIALEN